MASQTQFKQQCPSCEAMVPIKDSSLVGKKVDCPKCKYRFVVEDPGAVSDGGGDEEPSSKVRTKTDESKAKGEKGGKSKSKSQGDGEGKKKKKAAEKKRPPVMLIAGIGL